MRLRLGLRPVRASDCRVHADTLLDFADGRIGMEQSAAALAHLDGCRACEDELSRVMLAIVGLRRIREDLASAEPSADAWVHLRDRIHPRRPSPWLIRSPLPTLALALSIVGVVMGPGILIRTGTEGDSASAPPHGFVDAAAVYERNRSLARPPLPRDPITILARVTAPQIDGRAIGPDGRGHQVTSPPAPPSSGRVE